MDKTGVKSEEKLQEEFAEELLLKINSKKKIINNFKTKYFSQNLYSNCANYFKERKEIITIKLNDLSHILDSFQQTISLSIKAISYLLIKIENGQNFNPILPQTINSNSTIKNSFSSIYNNNSSIFKIFKGETKRTEPQNKYNNILNNNKSCNYIYSKDLINSNKNTINNIKYKLIEGNNMIRKQTSIRTHLVLDNSKFNSNFNNYIQNLKDIRNSNNYRNYSLNSMRNKNNTYNGKKEFAPTLKIRNNSNFENINYNNLNTNNINITNNINNTNTNINQKSEYIKIKNFKVKIKSPLRKTLKEMVKKQKSKINKYANSTNNLVENFIFQSNKFIINKKIIDEENKTQTLYKDNKYYKLFFAEKYGEGNYDNFLKKYRTNKINKSIIQKELNILSKLFNYSNSQKYQDEIIEKINKNNFKNINNNNMNNEIIQTNKNINSSNKDCNYKTPKSVENNRNIIKKNKLRKINIIDDNNNNLSQRYYTNKASISKFISHNDFNNNPDYKYNNIN